MVSSSFVALAAIASVMASHVDGHSYMTEPMPTWSVGFAATSPAGLIDGQDYLPVPEGMTYSSDPEINVKSYWTAFNESEYTSLKDFADKTMTLQSLSPFGEATKDCGFSVSNGTARDLPKQVQWKDFGYSHQGPCEVWCDEKLAFTDSNCALHYPEVPANIPYDVEICIGAKILQSYWIALHGLPWQLYLNCAPLKTTGTSNGSPPADDAPYPANDDEGDNSPETPPASPPVNDAPDPANDYDGDNSPEAPPASPPVNDAPDPTNDYDGDNSPETPPASPPVNDTPDPANDDDDGNSPETPPASPSTKKPTSPKKCSRRK